MRAIAIIDMPKDCDDCPFNYDMMECMAAADLLKPELIEGKRNKNCPLKVFPKWLDADRFINDTIAAGNYYQTMLQKVKVITITREDIDKMFDEVEK